MSHPLKTHWVAVKRILWYLKGTISWGLHLKPPFAPIFITTFCDANWAFDPDDRRLNFGACVFFGPNLISWWSKKQSVIARSSLEAEYRSHALATTEVS